MSTLLNKRRPRKTQPAPEYLDSRTAPAAVGAAAALAAELRVEARHVSRWEIALATSRPGSGEQRFLIKQIARTEGRMAHQEARLAGIQARAMARMHAANLARAAAAAMAAGAQPLPGQPRPVLVTASPFEPFVPAGSSSSGSATDSGNGSAVASSGGQSGSPNNTGSQSSLPDNVSQTLDVIYDAYQQNTSDFPANLPSTNGANLVVIQGTSVGIQVHDSNPANFDALLSDLQNAGMQISASSAQYGTVIGLLPITQLPTVAALPDAPSVTALFQVMTH